MIGFVELEFEAVFVPRFSTMKCNGKTIRAFQMQKLTNHRLIALSQNGRSQNKN